MSAKRSKQKGNENHEPEKKSPNPSQVAEIECHNISNEEANSIDDPNGVNSQILGSTDKRSIKLDHRSAEIRLATTSGAESFCSAGEISSSGGLGSPSHSQSMMVDDHLGAGLLDDESLLSRPTGRLNRNLIMAALISALGSSFQHGYNGGVVNAPEKLITNFINQTKTNSDKIDTPSEAEIDFILSLVVSTFSIGGFIGALMTAFVADRLGRRGGLFYNSFLVFLACPMMASARSFRSYRLLVAGRLLIGVNAGLNAGLAPLYLNEIAPVQLRGAFGTVYQLVLTVSVLISNILGLPLIFGTESLWPFLFIVPVLPAALMLATLPHCCESPKFLLLVKRRELQAQQSLAWFRNTGDIQDEMDELRAELERSKSQPDVTLAEMWCQKSLRRPTVISVVMMLSQQLSGINAILYYSTSIFRDAGLSQQSALRATLGMSLVNVLMTGVSLVLVDRAGRKTLHMSGLLGMAVSCTILALCLGPGELGTGETSSGSSLLAICSVYLFIAMFASGPGSIPWFLVGELFPSNARPLASSIVVAVNWLANFTVTLCFLPLTDILHGYTFLLFAFLLLLFYLFTYLKVPETKGASSEEISALFVG